QTQMEALHDVVQAGWVRYIGMSSCHACQFQAMQNYAIAHDLSPCVSIQHHYTPLYRAEERGMYPTLKLHQPAISLSPIHNCAYAMQTFGAGSLIWSPLAMGL
ncbi:hypothetical protein GLOTRDRAFT_13977, partial [Gloeophyllum trabeum ATCC 11539]